MVGLAFVFFYAGGGAACRKLKEQRIKRAPKDVAKDIVGENYVHPTLRTEDMKGTGLQNVPPVDQALLEVEDLVEKLVDRLMAEAKSRAQR